MQTFWYTLGPLRFQCTPSILDAMRAMTSKATTLATKRAPALTNPITNRHLRILDLSRRPVVAHITPLLEFGQRLRHTCELRLQHLTWRWQNLNKVESRSQLLP